MTSSLLLYLLLTAAAANSNKTAHAVDLPSGFLGVWGAESDQCGTELDDLRLTLHPHRLQFHESDGQLISISASSDLEIVIAAEMSGEGETWRTYRHFSLSDDGSRLSDITDAPELIVVRHRCAAR